MQEGSRICPRTKGLEEGRHVFGRPEMQKSPRINEGFEWRFASMPVWWRIHYFHHIIDQCLAWLLQILRGISADVAGLGTGAQAADGCSADSLAGRKSAS